LNHGPADAGRRGARIATVRRAPAPVIVAPLAR